MTENLKNTILKAGAVLQSFGAVEVFFFGSVARASLGGRRTIDLAVSGLPPEIFYRASGAMLNAVRARCNLVDLDEKNPLMGYLKSHKLRPDLFSGIKAIMGRLRRLVDTYRPLIDKVRLASPSEIELIALAGVLELFYSGLDAAFKRIVIEFDRAGLQKDTTIGDIDALERMAVQTPRRDPVISEIVTEQLQPYLAFRRAFRNPLGFEPDWPKMRDLVFEAEEILALVEAELANFLSAHEPPGRAA